MSFRSILKMQNGHTHVLSRSHLCLLSTDLPQELIHLLMMAINETDQTLIVATVTQYEDVDYADP